jgi:flagellar motor switch protein FliN
MSNLESFDFRSRVVESTVEVFNTMVAMQIEPSQSGPQDIGDTDRGVVAMNITGAVDGIINIQIPTDLARLMTAKRLDKEPETIEGDAEIRDLLSEIISVVADNLISALADAGLTSELSKPSITYQSDFTIKSLKMERFERFCFKCQQEWIIVECGLQIQQDEEDSAEDPQERKAEIDAEKSEAMATESQDPEDAPPAQQQVDHPPTAMQEPKSCEDVDLDLLLDIPLEIKVELGRAKIQIQELLSLVPGSAVKLIKLEGEPVDLLANDILIARGEVVVQNEKYGIRVTEITSRLDRIRSFGF